MKNKKENIPSKNIQIVFINGRIRSEWDGEEKICKECGEVVGFAKTPSGKISPFHLDFFKTSHVMVCKRKVL